MSRVITFGEIMMRLNPEGYLRFVQAEKFEATYAGGEANVAVSLANYGMDAAFVSKVPAHEIGQCAVNELRRYGVDTKFPAAYAVEQNQTLKNLPATVEVKTGKGVRLG